MTRTHAPATFGALAPSAIESAFRRLGAALPTNYWGRRLASLLLGPAGGRSNTPRDIPVFGSQNARLHPFDNICEKRVYLTPQLWDPAERAALSRAISAAPGSDFYFLDVGANVGLYALYARAAAVAAGKSIQIACIEPDPEMRRRLAFNVAASDAGEDIRVFPYAAARVRETLKLAVNAQSRGMTKLSADGALSVQGAPLHEVLLLETGFPRLDAMKIDIEGAEFDALDAFFQHAPEQFLPALVILETSHADRERSALDRCRQAGYIVKEQTRLNAILALNVSNTL
ncbi:MAG: FkbM family methyltransferase [Pseudomonadota bacterium]